MTVTEQLLNWLSSIFADQLEVTGRLTRCEGGFIFEMEALNANPLKFSEIQFIRGETCNVLEGDDVVSCLVTHDMITQSGLTDLVCVGLTEQDRAKPLFIAEGGKLIVNFNLVIFCIWMLLRREEASSESVEMHDLHSRFPARHSFAYRNGFLERPVIDEWFCVLKQAVHETCQPNEKIKRILLSVDLDEISRFQFCRWRTYFRRLAGSLLKFGSLKQFVAGIWVRLRRASSIQKVDPYFTFRLIEDAARRLNAGLLYFVMTGKGGHPFDNHYDLKDRRVLDFLNERAQFGTVGLHPCYAAGADSEKLKADIQYFVECSESFAASTQPIISRMHFLRWHPKYTPVFLNVNGVTEDHSMCFADRPGFRAGTSKPYQWFDIEANKALDIVMVPFVLMDVSIIDDRYAGLSDRQAFEGKVSELADAVLRVGGNFSFLWHNSELNTKKKTELFQILTNVLGARI